MKITYDKAIELLDHYVQKRTTHGTKNLIHTMQSLCAMDFVSIEDQQDFANQCSNFDKWIQETGRTSIGRKQFEEWWEIQDTGMAGSFSDEAVKEFMGLEEDPSPFDTDKDEYIRLLEAEVKELRKRLKEIRELVNPWD